jgi:2'-5' RNA ligase
MHAAEFQERSQMNVIRAFIAITLSSEIHHNLDQVITNLKSRLEQAPVRWMPANNIHLTIKFLGDVSVSNQEILTKMLMAEVSRHTPFEISVGDLGVFPSMRRPRVIWAGVKAPQELLALHRGVEAEMARLGYAPEERAFSPHLTLGRISRNAGNDDYRQIAEVLSTCKVGFLGALRVQSVDLYRSELHPDGAVYTRLYEAPLGTLKD